MCVEIPHLRYVVAAAEHRSFRRAAAALNITQPTLSKRIRELEDRLGVLLFERSTGGAHVTAEGEDFVAGARRVLAELDQMETHAKAAKVGDAGRLDIGFYTSMSGPLRETVFSFKQQHEQIDVNIIEDGRSTLIPLLDRGAIDIAVVLGEPSYQGLCPSEPVVRTDHGRLSEDTSARRAQFRLLDGFERRACPDEPARSRTGDSRHPAQQVDRARGTAFYQVCEGAPQRVIQHGRRRPRHNARLRVLFHPIVAGSRFFEKYATATDRPALASSPTGGATTKVRP